MFDAGQIDPGLVFDVSSPVGVLESVEGLLQVAVGNGNTCNHESAAVTSQGILQRLGFVSHTKLRVCVPKQS